MLQEHPIVLVWLDHNLRNNNPPVTLDTLLQLFQQEYDITNEQLNNFTKHTKTQFVNYAK